MVYKWYILPIGGLYNPYHLLGEPETAIDMWLYIYTSKDSPSYKWPISPTNHISIYPQSHTPRNKKKHNSAKLVDSTHLDLWLARKNPPTCESEIGVYTPLLCKKLGNVLSTMANVRYCGWTNSCITSSIRVHFPASYVSLPECIQYHLSHEKNICLSMKYCLFNRDHGSL